MPARAKKTDEKPAWVVEEVSAPEVTPEVVAPAGPVETFVEPKIMEPKVPVMLDLDAKSNPFANLGLILGVLAAFVVGVVVGIAGVKMYGNKDLTSVNLAVKQEETAPTATVAPSPTTKPIERSEISVAVLNGSGKTGAASKMADYLEKLGYKIQRTGNATKDVDGPSEVYINGDDKKMGEQVAADLKGEYSVNSEIKSDYDSSVALVVVVVGSE
ncbi:MAG: LytR C-terminal domain-containing protein [Patescibacteria group bacterium]